MYNLVKMAKFEKTLEALKYKEKRRFSAPLQK